MEHADLVQEMVFLEKLTAQERLKYAKRRRQQQLAGWTKRETLAGNGAALSSTPTNGLMTSTSNNSKKKKSPGTKRFLVQFPANIVLLEGNKILLFLHVFFVLVR